MNILMIVDRYPPQHHGGVWYTALDLKAAYERLGAKCIVLTSGVRNEAEEKSGVYRLHHSLLLSALKTNFVLHKFIAEHQIEYIHLHQPLAPLFLLWRRFLPVKTVLATFHGSFVEAFREVRGVVVSGTKIYPTRDEYLQKFLTYPLHVGRDCFTYLLADKVTAVNHEILLQLQRDYGRICRREGPVVPSGMDQQERRKFEPQLSRPLKLMTMSSLRLCKRVHNIVLALPGVLASGVDVHLTVIGGGRSYQKYLEQLSQNTGVADHVTITGYKPREQALELLRHADIFCLPSSREGSPLAAFEAMSLGIPVVGSDIAAFTECLTNRKNILLVPVDSVDDLAAAIIDLAANSDLRQAIETAGYEWVSTHRTWDGVAQRYICELTKSSGTNATLNSNF